MKKILMVLLISVLLLPMVVKADAYPMVYHYNKNIVKGGELQINVNYGESSTIINEFTFKYDQSILSITKEDIVVTSGGFDVTDSKDLNITIENGVVSIKSDKSLEKSVDLESYDNSIGFELRFKTLKAGTAEVTMHGYAIVNNDAIVRVDILPNTCEEKCGIQANDNEPIEDDKTETTTTEKEANKTTESKTDNTFFYGSIIINVLQLIAIIILLIVGKVRKNKIVE